MSRNRPESLGERAARIRQSCPERGRDIEAPTRESTIRAPGERGLASLAPLLIVRAGKGCLRDLYGAYPVLRDPCGRVPVRRSRAGRHVFRLRQYGGLPLSGRRLGQALVQSGRHLFGPVLGRPAAGGALVDQRRAGLSDPYAALYA